MRIGIPKEIKDGEARVGATPAMVKSLVEAGHSVLVESGAGARIGFGDPEYALGGAEIVASAEDVYGCAMVVKVKELQKEEYPRLQRGTVVAGYQQLARDPALLNTVLERGVTCLAYEGVTLPDGGRPLLAPMSTIAGLMSAQIAAWALQRREGPLSGSGVLLMAMEGVPTARVLIVGDGVAGRASAESFLKLGCQVTVLGADEQRLHALAAALQGISTGRLETGLSTEMTLALKVVPSDVVIGAVAIPGRVAPKLISRAMLRSMRPGSVFIDIGIDMGGIAETSRQTKLSDPLYVEEGVLHYCVPNIPAQVPRAATQALTAATGPYIQQIADQGLGAALDGLPGLMAGLLVHDGHVVNRALAEDCGQPFVSYQSRPITR